MLFKLKNIIQRKCARVWRRLLEQPRRLVGLFCKSQLIVFGRLAKGHCLATLHMSRFICRLYKRNGALFTAQYLKQASSLVLWYVGSRGVAPRPALKMHMNLTRGGLPAFIPSLYRKRIRMRDAPVIQMVLTVLALNRLMKVGKPGWRRVVHKTIHHPKFFPSQDTRDWAVKLLTNAGDMLKAYVPNCHEIPLNLGFSWEPVFTSGPNTFRDPRESGVFGPFSELWTKYRTSRYGRREQVTRRYRLTLFHTLPVDATALMTLWSPEFLAKIARVWYEPRIHYPTDIYTDPVLPTQEGADGFNWFLGTLLIPPAQALWWDTLKTRPENGRFGLKLEGAGKVRTFAIPNPILQRLLKPLHDWEMSILSTLSMDGTYDQLSPLWRLQGKRELYSFDLKAATDLFPAVLSASMLSGLLGQSVGETWSRIMSSTAFRSPEKMGNPLRARVYRFTRGQPLGFYSSWPSFALTHHMVVWLAAFEVYPGRRFKDYALLGDDIVIADQCVAGVYRRIMTEMGGVINMDKSLISHNGCCEFAKRFIMDNDTDRKDASPLSLACILLAYSNIAVGTFRTLGCSLTTSFRLRGAGYRVLSRVDASAPEKVFNRLSRRWRRHWLSLFTPTGLFPLPLTLWLAFPEKGGLTCYEVGMVRWYILERIAPRDIDEASVNLVRLFWRDHEETFERFLVSFMQSHLRYLNWYCTVLFDYDRPLDDLLKPPVSPRRLERASDDSQIVRYGLIFKAWDLLRSRRAPLALSVSLSRNRRDIVGPWSLTTF